MEIPDDKTDWLWLYRGFDAHQSSSQKSHITMRFQFQYLFLLKIFMPKLTKRHTGTVLYIPAGQASVFGHFSYHEKDGLVEYINLSEFHPSPLIPFGVRNNM